MDLFPSKCLTVTKQACSGKKCQGYTSPKRRKHYRDKPMKDRLTVLLCGNANGDFKIKPLLMYHSENPRVFKKTM